jgi:hypothetical protein
MTGRKVITRAELERALMDVRDTALRDSRDRVDVGCIRRERLVS